MKTEELPAFFDALEHWAAPRSGAVEQIAYGDHRDQVVDLRLPVDRAASSLVVVLHGGFWRPAFTRRNTTALSVALTEAGYATGNLEYRRPGPGGWRTMLADVRDAAGKTGAFDRIVAVGHSAGGHLALWLAAEGVVDAAVALGGICDLAAGARADLGDGAVQEFLGGSPEQVPEAYLAADPASRLPLGVPQFLLHGVHDDRVPILHAKAYAERACIAGDECRLVEVDGGHFEPIDPRSTVWPDVLAVVREALSSARSGVVA